MQKVVASFGAGGVKGPSIMLRLPFVAPKVDSLV